MSKASFKTTNEWKNINWAKVQRKVFKLQKRIFQAVKSGQKAKARNFQKLLMKSHYAKLLSVRKVTQDNRGKRTAGIDGQLIVNPQQREELAKELITEGYKSKPLRRVWIPKPGKDEKRPLGIPTIKDRAMQTLVKLTLEPYWEAQFEGTSYGFRPGRSAHDAIQRIFATIRIKPRYVLDADIAKCFDQINHKYLLSKLECPNNLKQLVKQWLKAGVMDNGIFEKTEKGTPQGGTISPLLANIALDGMIRDVSNSFPESYYKNGRQISNNKPKIIRYADDFVVLHNELQVIQQCKELISQWLSKVGLELKPEKTRICHTLNEMEINGVKVQPGFDFLGFNIRTYHVGKHHGFKAHHGKKVEVMEFKTLIKPSEKSIKAHREELKRIVQKNKKAPQAVLINEINPVIIGWCNYYKTVSSHETFESLIYYMWILLRAWTVSRTGHAGYEKLRKYFSYGKIGHWTFQTKDKYSLYYHSKTKIVRHALVKPEASPYDGNWTYWSTRMGKYPETPTRVSKLMVKQKGYCNHCHQSFMPTDIVEIDHIIPKSLGGKDEYNNLQLLHRHCHDTKTSNDGSLNRADTLPDNYYWGDDMLITAPMTKGK